ncbi:MAG: hypothetical protein ABW167_06730 [Baekduia sp.]
MDTIELPENEHNALLRLVTARREHPEGDYFEHDRTSVRMPGARHNVNLSIPRETLRRLGHRKLIDFTHTRDGFGRGRWTFELSPRAADFV